jgi:hypothetical protein
MDVYKDLCISRNIARERVYCKHKAFGIEIAPISDYRTSRTGKPTASAVGVVR